MSNITEKKNEKKTNLIKPVNSMQSSYSQPKKCSTFSFSLSRMGTKGMRKGEELVAMRWERVVENTLGLYPTVLLLLCMNSNS